MRDAALSGALRADIDRRMDHLFRQSAKILRCKATVLGPGRHHRQGHFELRIYLKLPGAELEISRQSGEQPEEAVREAFAAARRQVKEQRERRRRKPRARPAASDKRDTGLFE